jgi:acyl-coenzyme A thioesterase PaaI-like protein
MTEPQPWEADKARLLEFTQNFPFFNLVGLRVVDLRPGWSQTEIAWREDLCQPAGIIHGGMIATLVDTGTSSSRSICASNTCAPSPAASSAASRRSRDSVGISFTAKASS